MQNDNLDEQRKFQRIPRQKPFPAKDKAAKSLEQAKCMRIPRDVVREARIYQKQQEQPQESFDPVVVLRQFVSGFLR